MNWLRRAPGWPPADDVPQMLDERAELGARHGVVLVVDETGMNAELAQPGDRAQDREAVAVNVVDQASGFVPIDTMPAAMRWFAEYQQFTRQR